jgi:hypothetical protein
MRADYPVDTGVIDAPSVGMVVGVIGCPLGSQGMCVFVEEAIPHQRKVHAADADKVARFIAAAIAEMPGGKKHPSNREVKREPSDEEIKQGVELLTIC